MIPAGRHPNTPYYGSNGSVSSYMVAKEEITAQLHTSFPVFVASHVAFLRIVKLDFYCSYTVQSHATLYNHGLMIPWPEKKRKHTHLQNSNSDNTPLHKSVSGLHCWQDESRTPWQSKTLWSPDSQSLFSFFPFRIWPGCVLFRKQPSARELPLLPKGSLSLPFSVNFHLSFKSQVECYLLCT